MKGIIEMKKCALTVGVAALAALVSLAACSNNSNQANQTTSSTTTTTSTSGAQPHNQADVTFAQQMIPHHQQAIQMSDMVLAKQGIDPRVIDLANQIKAAQGPEIQHMDEKCQGRGYRPSRTGRCQAMRP